MFAILFIYMGVLDYVNDGMYGSFNCILFDHQKVHPNGERNISPMIK